MVFFQVDLEPSDRKKISFLDSNQKLWQFKRMPQGYKNSPAIFQRFMFFDIRWTNWC